MKELTPQDYQVMDVLTEGPDSINIIAQELALTHESVRRSIHRLKFAGYVRPLLISRGGACRPSTIYEAVRTRKAA